MGVSERLIVVDDGDGPIHIINPEIIEAEGSVVDREGCLSIPGVAGYVERSERVAVTGLDGRGRPLRLNAEGLLARILQHEIDHLDGILFIDKATSITRSDAGEGRTGRGRSRRR